MKIDFIIDETLQGHRLDHAVAAFVENCSRNRASVLIKAGEILVAGQKKKPGYRVKPGERITGFLSPDRQVPVVAQAIDITILHEDNHIIVVNKAAGMVVHPAPGNFSDTLVNALLNHDPELKNVGKDEHRAGIVHRLDKDTSGAMVVAKNVLTYRFLQGEFKQRRVSKKYLALISGDISRDEGRITMPIGRHPIKRKLMSVNSPRGRQAETLWKVRERLDGATLVEAQLKTGRTHQIRVHFHSLGHPLIGDKVYGFKRKAAKRKNPAALIDNKASRQMLHAWKLGFTHPGSGEPVEFRALVPDDFRDMLHSLGSGFKNR